MITKIGFKNFRRFHEQTDIELGGINMFVGGNNAGKSTVVKALLLMANFLKNTKIDSRPMYEKLRFYFNAPFANVDTFKRALCWNANDDKTISFNIDFDHYNVSVVLFNASTTDQPYADVKTLSLYDSNSDTKFDFDIASAKLHIQFGVNKERNGNANLQKLIKEKEDVASEIKGLNEKSQDLMSARFSNKTSNKDDESIEKQLSETLNLISNLKARYATLLKMESKLEDVKPGEEVDILLTALDKPGMNIISSYLYGIVCDIEEKEDESDEVQTLIRKKSLIEHIANDFESTVDKMCVEYIYAHSASQKVLFNWKDNNDYLSHSIQDMYTNIITSSSNIGEVMKGWLNDFKIADDFKIAPVSAKSSNNEDDFNIGNGEGYAFGVHFEGKWHDLGDMGRGSIQLLVLFMNLAVIIKKYENTNDRPIVMVEEPEQNLHPALQSKLADLFEKIHDNFNINFIVETHSEYVIRKTQVLVADSIKSGKYTLDNNPFKVYFYDKDKGPYDMIYRPDGNFSNEFGSGFYDEATNLLFEII